MDLRSVLREYPTGVTIVTTSFEGENYGGTMNSFTSVSLEPPLVAVFIGKQSRTAKAILKSKSFAVNILRGDQGELASMFAQDKISDKFDGVQTFSGRNGVPIIKDALGILQCDLYLSEEIADHVLVVGEVKDALLNDAQNALLYCNKKFSSMPVSD